MCSDIGHASFYCGFPQALRQRVVLYSTKGLSNAVWQVRNSVCGIHLSQADEAARYPYALDLWLMEQSLVPFNSGPRTGQVPGQPA